VTDHAPALSDDQSSVPDAAQHAAPWVAFVSLLLALFPAAIIAIELALLYAIVSRPGIPLFLALCIAPYLVPLLAFRILNAITPLKEGRSILTKQTYSSWVGAYRLQHLYILFPFLESVLHAVPGLYSFWLRAWGSKIGKNVIWGGTATITDRSMLVIGDDVFVGNLVYMSPHVVNPTREHLLLYLKKIRIGSSVFIGAGSRLGPGAVVHDNSFVPILTDLYLNEHFPPASKPNE